MAWYTLAQAAERGWSREAWQAGIASGQVTSYLDGQGQRRVWLDEAGPQGEAHLGEEVSRLREEVKRLRAELRQALDTFRAAVPAEAPRASAPSAPSPQAEPAPAPAGLLSPLAADSLRLVVERWTGSDLELEREAELPHRFLTKARRGERNGPRATAAWIRLRRYLDGRAAA